MTAVWRSWLDAAGLAGRTKAARVLTAIVVSAAALVTLIGALLPAHRAADRPLTTIGGIGIAAALAAAAQLGRLRFRLGRGVVAVSWAEAALVIGAALAPPGWLPLATLVGVAAAWALLSWLDEHRNLAELAHLTGSLTLGAGAAALVSRAIGGNAPLTSAREQAALAAGALAYLVVTFALAVLTLALHRDAAPGRIVARVLSAKLPMFAGNLLVGLAAVFAVVHSPFWLFAFVPALWLLQRTYRFHLRAEEERRRWEAFAAATATLPGHTEADVAEAGLDGALAVFGARRVEIEIKGDGEARRYTKDGPGLDNAVAGFTGPVIIQTLTVAGEVIGELTIRPSEPLLPEPRDEVVISAYGDALAGALHDAAAHERVAQLQEKVAYDTIHDRLTGLLNRATLAGEGDRLAREADAERHFALILLDLDDFHGVNGTLGHKGGDQVLRLIADRLTGLSREHELVARTGDDEFALLIPTIPALADSAALLHETPSPLPLALRRARELAEHVAQPMEVAGVRLAVEITAGVAVGKVGRTDVTELIRRASLALGQAKRQGRSVAAYDAGQDTVTTDGLALLAELQDALLAEDQIVLHLQPAVDLVTATPTGVEALVRWKHPRRGQLSPDAFIATVEHSALLAEFTRRVLDLALASASDWTAAGLDLPVSVNVSARSLLDPSFPAQITDALHRHRTPASRLVLEITESVAVSAQLIVDDVLAELRAIGVRLSLDDFGTGYSSLSIVTRVPVDEIKIDRSFVDNMIETPAAGAVVRGAVELGARLGVRVVAEGVETNEQRAALIDLDCPAAQGYHFCRPMPADRIVETLVRLTNAAPAEVRRLRADDAS